MFSPEMLFCNFFRNLKLSRCTFFHLSAFRISNLKSWLTIWTENRWFCSTYLINPELIVVRSRISLLFWILLLREHRFSLKSLQTMKFSSAATTKTRSFTSSLLRTVKYYKNSRLSSSSEIWVCKTKICVAWRWTIWFSSVVFSRFLGAFSTYFACNLEWSKIW